MFGLDGLGELVEETPVGIASGRLLVLPHELGFVAPDHFLADRVVSAGNRDAVELPVRTEILEKGGQLAQLDATEMVLNEFVISFRLENRKNPLQHGAGIEFVPRQTQDSLFLLFGFASMLQKHHQGRQPAVKTQKNEDDSRYCRMGSHIFRERLVGCDIKSDCLDWGDTP